MDLPEELVRSLKILARRRGVPLKGVMASVIAAGLRAELGARGSPLPVAVPAVGKPLDITSELLHRLEGLEDLDRYARSFGR